MTEYGCLIPLNKVTLYYRIKNYNKYGSKCTVLVDNMLLKYMYITDVFIKLKRQIRRAGSPSILAFFFPSPMSNERQAEV